MRPEDFRLPPRAEPPEPPVLPREDDFFAAPLRPPDDLRAVDLRPEDFFDALLRPLEDFFDALLRPLEDFFDALLRPLEDFFDALFRPPEDFFAALLRPPEEDFFDARLRPEDAPELPPPLEDDLRPRDDDELFFADLRPEPDLRPPPDSLFTVAQARDSASSSDTPLSLYPSSMCSACRFCLSV